MLAHEIIRGGKTISKNMVYLCNKWDDISIRNIYFLCCCKYLYLVIALLNELSRTGCKSNIINNLISISKENDANISFGTRINLRSDK